ncbi:MAG: M48 family metalloprotease [Burkholderiales bacterium]|nr:M48 family metalloprotease [Burkholderiales bacterium]
MPSSFFILVCFHRLPRIFLCCLLACTAGCATPKISALTSSEAKYGQTEEEKKLLARAKEFDQELDRKGMLLETPALVNYVRSIGQPLVPPEAAGIVDFKFKILRSPVVNAFALPNGSIYLSVGLLARLHSEAELAQVMGHEIAHVVLRHALKVYETNRSNIVAAHIADLFLFGTSIAYLPYLASVASYSREQEEEADQSGLRAIAAGGYSPNEAIQVFDRMQEVKNGEALEGSWYSSHPSNKQRVDALKEMVRTGAISQQQPKVGNTSHRDFVARIVIENIQLKLHARQYELALDAANRSLAENPKSAQFHFYKGEAYRHMADDPKGAAREHGWIYGKSFNDKLVAEFETRRSEFYQFAEDAYRQALALDSRLPMAERGWGLVNLGRGEYDAARERLTAYLAQNKNISDREYISNLLKGINK